MKTQMFKQIPATTVLLVVNSLIFLLMFVTYGFAYTSGEAIFTFGGIYGQLISFSPQTQAWRLFAATFVHIGLEHFLVNMAALYFLGQQVEAIFGWWKFLLIYLLSGLMGSVFVVHFSPDALSAGASTALCGLTAVLVFLRFVVTSSYIEHLGKALMPFLLMNLLIGFLPGVSLAGHLGGFAGGLLCTIIFPIKGLRTKLQAWHRFLAVVIYVALVWFLF